MSAGSGAGEQATLVFRRQWRAAVADPGPSFVLPMMPSLLMLVVFTSLFDSLARLDGFDTTGFTATGFEAYVVPGVAVLVAMLGAGYTASSLAADLRTGYADRMTLAGVRPAAHLVGRLGFEALRLLPGVAVVVAIGLAVGAEADNGIVGLAVLIALVSLLGVAFTGVFHLVAIASKDPQTPFTMQPLGLPLAFLSSALVPLAIMPTWSETAARVNPVSIVVDAARHAMIGDLWSSQLVTAIGVLAIWTISSQLVAWLLLRHELEGR